VPAVAADQPAVGKYVHRAKFIVLNAIGATGIFAGIVERQTRRSAFDWTGMGKLTISAAHFADCSMPYFACVLWGTKVRLLKSIVLSRYFWVRADN